jgi:hypothetical protein
MLARLTRCRHAEANHPTANIIAKNSRDGISTVRIASAGKVAHSGIAAAPTHVQTLRDIGRRFRGGDPMVS